MEYQHYIGEGPEAQALIDECRARVKVKDEAVRAFVDKYGFTNGWHREHLLCGPATSSMMDDAEARAKGVKYHGALRDDFFMWAPHRGCLLGR